MFYCILVFTFIAYFSPIKNIQRHTKKSKIFLIIINNKLFPFRQVKSS